MSGLGSPVPPLHGLSTPIPSIKVVRDLCGITLGAAKELVHDSRAWEDPRVVHDDLHGQLFDAFSSSNDEEQKRGDAASGEPPTPAVHRRST